MVMMTGSNASDISERNRSAILRVLQQGEACSRADIARQTGLTQAAITKIVAGLIDMGIVSEGGFMTNGRRHRAIALTLNAGQFQILGMKFMRGMYSWGVFDISGKVYTQAEQAYAFHRAPDSVLKDMKAVIRQTLAQYPRVVAIGLAVPGPYLRREGHIAVMTQIPEWQKVNFIDEMTGVFDKPVFIEHDANAGVLAEWLFGDDHLSAHTLAYLLVGEGVGAGVVERGHLILGQQGAACEIGHVSLDVNGPPCQCGNRGCLENLCSSSAVIRLARERAPQCFLDAEPSVDRVFEAARRGDAGALSVVHDVARAIGFGCVNLINAYNPGEIIIGDAVARGGDLMLPIIKEVVNERVVRELSQAVTIRISGLPVDPTLYGAAAAATNKALQLPSVFLKAGAAKIATKTT